MATSPDDEPDELESFMAELHRYRAARVALFHADHAAWLEEGKQRTERAARECHLVSFDMQDPNCVPDNYRYADLCRPLSAEVDNE